MFFLGHTRPGTIVLNTPQMNLIVVNFRETKSLEKREKEKNHYCSPYVMNRKEICECNERYQIIMPILETGDKRDVRPSLSRGMDVPLPYLLLRLCLYICINSDVQNDFYLSSPQNTNELQGQFGHTLWKYIWKIYSHYQPYQWCTLFIECIVCHDKLYGKK